MKFQLSEKKVITPRIKKNSSGVKTNRTFRISSDKTLKLGNKEEIVRGQDGNLIVVTFTDKKTVDGKLLIKVSEKLSISDRIRFDNNIQKGKNRKDEIRAIYKEVGTEDGTESGAEVQDNSQS